MGTLTREARRGFGKLALAYFAKNLDFLITSIREGTHSPYSLHPLGLAWDYDPQGVSIEYDRMVLGPDYDVVEESNHRHAELDPKGI